MNPATQTQAKRRPVIYVTRSDVSWYSRNANAFQKPWMLSQAFDLLVVQPSGVTLPAAIERNCRLTSVRCGDVEKQWSLLSMLRFMVGSLKRVSEYACQDRAEVDLPGQRLTRLTVATGFDVPCLLVGWWAKWRWGLNWLVFCWDPPALSWRDRSDILGRSVAGCADFVFRSTVGHADRLIMNIHLGVLNDIKFQAQDRQLIQMFNGCVPRTGLGESVSRTGDPWRVGVLSHATQAKGFDLVLDMFIRLAHNMPQLQVIWIGNVAADVRESSLSLLSHAGISSDRFALTGILDQERAFDLLSECGILLHPYLDVPSLRWNYPLKLIEYMCAGRAIVASDLPGVRSYIVSGQNGLLFRAGDSDALAGVLCRLLGDASHQSLLGARAKQDAGAYEWPRLNQGLVAKLCEE